MDGAGRMGGMKFDFASLFFAGFASVGCVFGGRPRRFCGLGGAAAGGFDFSGFVLIFSCSGFLIGFGAGGGFAGSTSESDESSEVWWSGVETTAKRFTEYCGNFDFI